MPYLTPEELPEERDCRALLIPASSEWFAIVSGALTELLASWNWQQQGAVTVPEAISAMQGMIDGYYEGCVASGCQQPTGLPVFRINPETWELEQLVNGEWVEPQGEYALPPTPAREEPTSEERRCLASANAVYALQVMYESLSDSFAISETLQAAIAGAFAAVVGLIGTVFALPLAGLVGVYAVLMGTVYATIEFITADLWNETFSATLACYFYECSTDVDGVIHFNIECIINRIGSATTGDFDLEDQIRLLLQVSWLLNAIGTQALDAAGAITAVDEADCEGCAPALTITIWNWDGTPPPAYGEAPAEVTFDEEFEAVGQYRNTVSGQDIYFLNMAFSRAVDIELLDQGTWAPLTYNGTASIYGWTYSEDNQDVGDYDFVRWAAFDPSTTLPTYYEDYHGVHFAGNGAFTLTLRLREPL